MSKIRAYYDRNDDSGICRSAEVLVIVENRLLLIRTLHTGQQRTEREYAKPTAINTTECHAHNVVIRCRVGSRGLGKDRKLRKLKISSQPTNNFLYSCDDIASVQYTVLAQYRPPSFISFLPQSFA